MEKEKLEYWAGVLNEARIHKAPIEQISHQIPEGTKFLRAHAYEIQELQWKRRSSSGEKQVGWKMGLTSEAKRHQMNLDSPLYGFLSDKMQIPDGGTFSFQGLIHPKIEPEVAFLIGEDLKGPITREQVLKACVGVASALEILDSRYQQFKYFSMEDVISDNSSSSHFVVGPWVKDFSGLDLKSLAMTMSVDGKTAQKGVSSDISGDPVLSVVQLCELLAQRDQYLKKGSLVLAGAATAAEALRDQMTVRLDVEGLPSVSVKVVQK